MVVPQYKFYRCMQHPNDKVARASHSVFVSFLSSGSDADQDDRLVLKEKLVFYYMQRALEVYEAIELFCLFSKSGYLNIRYMLYDLLHHVGLSWDYPI